MSASKRLVKHVPDACKFIIELGANEQAVLEYRVNSARKLMEFYHTESPEKYRGQGLAQNLTEAAFVFARQNQYKVIPTCTYTQYFIEKLATETERMLVASENA